MNVPPSPSMIFPHVMNQPESPHQAAIAGGTFKAKVRPTLNPQAAELVRIYEAVPGALTYPGCCPEGLAAVLAWLALEVPDWTDGVVRLENLAAMLRGEQP